MYLLNPQFNNASINGEIKGEIHGSRIEYMLSLCRNQHALREDAWNLLNHKTITHYFDEDGNTVIETFSNDRNAISAYCKKLIADGLVYKNGRQRDYEPKDTANKIREVLRRHLECDNNGDPNPTFDEDYRAEDAIADIYRIVGEI